MALTVTPLWRPGGGESLVVDRPPWRQSSWSDRLAPDAIHGGDIDDAAPAPLAILAETCLSC